MIHTYSYIKRQRKAWTPEIKILNYEHVQAAQNEINSIRMWMKARYRDNIDYKYKIESYFQKLQTGGK